MIRARGSPSLTHDRMTVPDAMSAERRRLAGARQRVLLLLLVTLGLVLAVSSRDLHARLTGMLPAIETVIREHPVLGVSVFLLFSAASAMLAFVSSAVIVPVAVHVWGETLSLALLWAGWTLGGVAAYTASRFLGRATAKALSSGPMLERYEQWLSRRTSFGFVWLFQVALPSEVPGYLLGLARYDFWKFLAALALAELPYAVATIYLGSNFLERHVYRLIIAGIAVAAFSGWAFYTLHRRFAARQV